MYCKNCGNIVDAAAQVCQSCGNNPNNGTNYCPECGHFCIPGDTECVQCKKSLVASSTLSEKIVTEQPAPQPQQPTQVQSRPQPDVQTQPQSKPQQQTVETKIGPKFLATDQRYCRNCGLVIPAEAVKCPFCDSATGANYCQKCGSGTATTDTVCSVCATPLSLRPNVGYIPSQTPVRPGSQNNNNNASNQRPQQQQRQQQPQHGYPSSNWPQTEESHDWLVTLLLCIFLGYLGVHRFYTKNYVAGVIQLLTGGGCGIWYIIDMILILLDSYVDGNGNKLKRNV